MEVFDLTRGTTTGTVRVPAKAGETAQFKIRSTKAKKVNGKSQTPERIAFTYSYANQAVVRASWEEDPSNAELYIVTLLVIRTNTANTEDNTTVPFTQNESGNVLNLTVVQEATPKTEVYIEFVGGNKIGESGYYDLYHAKFVATTPVASRLTINYQLGYGTSFSDGTTAGEDYIAAGSDTSSVFGIRVVAGNYPEVRDAAVTPKRR